MQSSSQPARSDSHLDACATLCAECALTCKRTFFTHCLQAGGEHVAAPHVQLLTDCVAACQVAADFIARRSQRHVATCGLCADICQQCAEECEAMGGMDACAATCRRCADSCRRMSQAA